MAENNTRMKINMGVTTNLVSPLNEASDEGIFNATPSTTPGAEILPSPSEDLTILHEKEAFTSAAKEAPSVVKKLLGERLASTLSGLVRSHRKATSRVYQR